MQTFDSYVLLLCISRSKDSPQSFTSSGEILQNKQNRKKCELRDTYTHESELELGKSIKKKVC